MFKTVSKLNSVDTKEHSRSPNRAKRPAQKSENPRWKNMLFGKDVVQPKLTVGPADDLYEQQADAVADATVSQSSFSHLAQLHGLKSCTSQLQKSSTANKSVSDSAPRVQKVVQSPGAGLPLNESVRSQVEPVLGADLSKVRVHTSGLAQQAASDIRAKAFTHKNDVFLGTGQSVSDLRLMAHEATHTVQQTGETRGKTGPLLQRDESDEGPTVVTLTNARFSMDNNLLRIARGEVDALSASFNGNNGAVSKVQRALVDLGFDLPLHRIDGSYGSETEDAIAHFRSTYMSATGNQLDSAAVIRLDEVAPAAGQQTEHNFDYERLFADGKLQVAVGFGYSDSKIIRENADGKREELAEDSSAVAVRKFTEWLTLQGFELALLGLDSDEYWELNREFSYPKSDGTRETKNIKIWLHLITPGEGAARAFRQGLAQSEVTIYEGHARYGSGPDFDEKSSPTENFRIGIDAALDAAGRQTRYQHAKQHGVAMDEEHDLKEMVASGEFDPDKYRVLFFSACTSMAYLDEIRSELGGPGNIDVVGSRVPTLFSSLESQIDPDEVRDFLSGLLAMQTVEQIVSTLEQDQIGIHQLAGIPVPSKGIFTSSGIGDNPVNTGSGTPKK